MRSDGAERTNVKAGARRRSHPARPGRPGGQAQESGLYVVNAAAWSSTCEEEPRSSS